MDCDFNEANWFDRFDGNMASIAATKIGQRLSRENPVCIASPQSNEMAMKSHAGQTIRLTSFVSTSALRQRTVPCVCQVNWSVQRTRN